jgi:single-stranded-DNA-specific exonuclease
VAQELKEEDLCGKLTYDLKASPRECTLEVFAQIAQLAPFGVGNPTPRLRVQGVVREVRPLGQGGKHLSLRLEADGAYVAVKAWGAAEALAGAVVGTTLDMVGKAVVNDFNGRVSAEVHWEGGVVG